EVSAGGRVWAAAAIALAAASGCSRGGAEAGAADAPDDGRWWAGGEPDEGYFELKLLADVRRILVDHCAPCHSGKDGIAEADFGAIFEPSLMIERGLIVPGEEATTSPLFVRIVDEEMPPSGAVDPADPARTIEPVSFYDQAILARWIEAGAPVLDVPPTPVTGLELREVMAKDAAALPAADLPFYRYVSLSAAYGQSGLRQAGLDAVVNTVATLFNSLSPSRADVPLPKLLLSASFDPIALRVDLRDYDLDAADWARLEAASEVVDRPGFPCKVPFLGIEQLLPLALNDEHVRTDGRVESVYSNIVLRRALERAGLLAPGQLVFEPREAGAPEGPLVSAVTLPELASVLGLDLKAGMAQGGEAALRLCVTRPELTTLPRCAQRDALPEGSRRGFWWSMSYVPNEDDELPSSLIGPGNGGLAPPAAGVTPFALVEGAAFWPWPNETLGFAIFDDQLRLRSTTTQYAPFTSAGGAMASVGITGCTYCHADGPSPLDDLLRETVDRGGLRPEGFTAAELDFVDRLFRSKFETDEQIARDNSASQASGFRTCLRGCETGLG
ncbi:MAG TPA: hypothetical protein VFS00_22975, partial [Polyangiaceae bacterium]|nr:hypothetical protein [Polyangiaceae bacterium]